MCRLSFLVIIIIIIIIIIVLNRIMPVNQLCLTCPLIQVNDNNICTGMEHVSDRGVHWGFLSCD